MPATPMLPEAQVTVRNLGLLLLQRGSHVLTAILFAALVPRFMGPVMYGQFNLLTSVALWVVFSGNLGITQIMSRYVPEFLHQGDREGLLKFIGQLAASRLLVGLLGGLLYFVVTVFWLRDLNWLALGSVALSVGAYILANYLFSLFLGLNQAARWGMSETLRRWLSLLFILGGLALGGITGVCLGLALTELAVLGLGLWWARSYLEGRHWGLDRRYLAPYLRLGLIFLGSDVIMSTFLFSGAALVWLVKADYTQVSYFGLAYQGYVLLSVAIYQFAMAFMPLLAGLWARQDLQGLRQWTEDLHKWLGVSAVPVFFGALFLGNDFVPLVLGEEFGPVALNLVILTLALLFQGPANVGLILAMMGDRPGLVLGAAVVRLAVFILLGIPLVAGWGSLGCSLAVALANIMASWFYLRRLRDLVPFSVRPWLLTLAAGGVCAPLVWLKAAWPTNLALTLAATAGYGGLLLLLGLLKLSELGSLWRALVSRQS